MRSSRPKVLHALGGRVLIRHVVDAVAPLDGRLALVIGPGGEAIGRQVPGAEIFVQYAGPAMPDDIDRPQDREGGNRRAAGQCFQQHHSERIG